MGEHTNIAWTDHTFNIVWGCTKVSPACDNCYAEELAKRYGYGWGKDAPRRLLSEHYWNDPIRWNRAAEKRGKPALVFCSSMADVFEDNETVGSQRDRLWPLIPATPWLRWLLLTKRPENIDRFLPVQIDLKTVWLGVTAENQEFLERRLRRLFAQERAARAAIRFLSCEPLLEEIDVLGALRSIPLPDILQTTPTDKLIDWLIVGGESGSKARHFEVHGARRLRDAAKALGAAFFMKQFGALPIEDGDAAGPIPTLYKPSPRRYFPEYDGFEYHVPVSGLIKHPKGEDPAEWPEDLRIREYPPYAMEAA